MERLRLTPPGEKRVRGERARLYVRWMPYLGAEVVALYELLRILPDLGDDGVEVEELAELLKSTPEKVEASLQALISHNFITDRDGWLEVAEHPPAAQHRKTKNQPRAREEARESAEKPAAYEAQARKPVTEPVKEPIREIEVVRAAAEGVSADDYFNFMGSLPAPHILEFLNGYCGRDGMDADVVREALRIASERDARRVGYVRGVLERWVERGVKTLADVELFEKDRKLRLVEESGAVKGGALRIGGGVNHGADRQSAARRREGYEWLFGE